MSDITLCDCEELWINIYNKKGSKYKLSSKGRLYGYKYKKYVGKKTIKGYIHTNGGTKFFSNCIHRLVYRYFFQINIEKYNQKYNEIDHINTMRNHNCICNLSCGSREDNNNNLLSKNNLIKVKQSKEHRQKMSKIKTGKYKKNKKAILFIYNDGRKKKYGVNYRNKGKRHYLSFYTEEEQKECELFINELYDEGLLL